MAEQHVRALQKRRSEFEDADFQLLLVIATDMGRKHDPARTSQRAIADRAGCHYNTVGGRIRKLETRGVVEVIKHGRQYFHSLPIIITDCHPSSQPQDNHNPPEVESDNQANGDSDALNTIVTDYHNFKAEVCDNLKTMTAAIEALTLQLSQLSSQIVTIHQRVNVMEDKIEEKKEEDSIPIGIQGAPKTGGAKRKSAADPRSSHPAIVAMKHVLGRYPSKDTYDLIIGRLGEAPDMAALSKARAEWTARGYNPANVLSQLEWYDSYRKDRNWTPPTLNGKGGQYGRNGHTPKPAPSQGLKEVKQGSGRY